MLAIIFITAIAIIVCWFQLEATSNKLKQAADQYQTKTELMMTMWDIARARESTFQNMLIIHDSFELDEIQMQHMSLGGRFFNTRRELMAMQQSAQEKRFMGELKKTASNSARIQDSIRHLVMEDKLDEAKQLSREESYVNSRAQMFQQFEKIFNYFREKASMALKEANETVLNNIKIILMLTALVLLLSATVGYFMIRKVAGAERKLHKEAEQRIATQIELEKHQGKLEADIQQAVDKYKATEAARVESQKTAAAFGQILETLLNEIFIFDIKSLNFLQVNKGAKENLGYSIEELKQMTPVDVNPEYTEEDFALMITPLLDGTQEKIVFTTTHKRKDKTIYPVEVNLQLSFIGHNPVLVAIALDITNRKKWENKLQRKKEEAERMANELAFQKTALEEHAIVCVADQSEIIQSVNNKYVEISEFNEIELVGGHFFIGLSGGQSEDEINAISESIHRGEIWHGIISFLRKDGTSYWTKTTITPFSNKDAEVYKFVVVSTDITEQKIIEEKLLISNLEIEKAHKELEQSQNMMLHTEKLASVGQLAAGIAHEINTPIQFVGDNTRFLQESFNDLLGLIEVYKELGNAANESKVLPELVDKAHALSEEVEVDYLSEEIPSAITQSLEGIERISKIVLSMKNFSHPGTDHLENVDLNHAIESTINVSRNEWKYVAEMVTEFDSSLLLVPCFPGEFNQVVLNMIVNAAHAIGDSRNETDPLGTITISTKLDDNNVEIRITDSGCGMDEEVSRHIFEQFFTTKGVGKGTGQGLSIAYAVIVDKHKGTVSVDSKPGKGSTFIIRLPMNMPVDKQEMDESKEIINKTGVM